MREGGGRGSGGVNPRVTPTLTNGQSMANRMAGGLKSSKKGVLLGFNNTVRRALVRRSTALVQLGATPLGRAEARALGPGARGRASPPQAPGTDSVTAHRCQVAQPTRHLSHTSLASSRSPLQRNSKAMHQQRYTIFHPPLLAYLLQLHRVLSL